VDVGLGVGGGQGERACVRHDWACAGLCACLSAGVCLGLGAVGLRVGRADARFHGQACGVGSLRESQSKLSN
jgi:hypothetical protein